MKKFCFIVFALLLSVTAFACSKKEEEKVEASLNLDKSELTLYVGDSETVTATVENTTNEVQWSSSDTNVASVSNGVVTAVGEGTATITATVDNCTKTVSVTVSVEKYTVTFQDDAGRLLKEETVAKGASATAPTVADKSGYEFAGWDKSFDNVTSDITVTATFKKVYTIKYELNGGYFLTSEDEITKFYDGENITLKEPAQPGTQFLGWATTASGTKYIKSTKELTEDETTLYAQYQTVTSFSITYNFNGGISSEGYLSVTSSAKASYQSTAFNANPSAFWSGGYTDYIYVCEKAADPGATFSDRIYVGVNSETGMYEVLSILTSGGSSWPSAAKYVITVSNSCSSWLDFNTNFTKKIQVGDTIVFSKTPSTTNKSVTIYAFDTVPESATYTTTVTGKKLTLITPSRLGFDFVGWYDAHGDEIVLMSDLYDGIQLIAQWKEKEPVTDISVNDVPTEMVTGQTFQVEASVVPTNAYFKQISYKTSDSDILTVSDAGLITAKNAGKATITLTDYMKKITKSYEITVYSIESIDVTFDSEYDGILEVNGTVQLTPKAFGKVVDGVTFTYTSSDSNVALVSSTGLVTALKEGVTSIVITDSTNTTRTLEVKVIVKTLSEADKVDQVLKLIAENNYARVSAGNVSLYNDGTERYYVSVTGSVNRWLFDEYKINRTYESNRVADTSGYKVRRTTDTIEFVCVHDTATLTGTVASIASGMSAGETSIHYTVGNDEIYSVVPEEYIAFHAGDGTGTTFEWYNTGVKAETNTAPTFTVIDKGNGSYVFGCNGVETSLAVPTSGSLPVRLTYLGPTWKIVDGYYYMGKTWYSSTYQYVASRGGNNDSIGIETNVNTSSDIFDTWQRTAQLVADILIRNNLDLTRVKMHNTFSGKNCPQNMLSGVDSWDEFMKMVALQYTIRKDYSDVEITMESNDPSIVDSTGRVYNAPSVTTTVSYTVTVKCGSTTKSMTLYSVVPGTTTWEQWSGRYSAATVWNEGIYDIAKTGTRKNNWIYKD